MNQQLETPKETSQEESINIQLSQQISTIKSEIQAIADQLSIGVENLDSKVQLDMDHCKRKSESVKDETKKQELNEKINQLSRILYLQAQLKNLEEKLKNLDQLTESPSKGNTQPEESPSREHPEEEVSHQISELKKLAEKYKIGMEDLENQAKNRIEYLQNKMGYAKSEVKPLLQNQIKEIERLLELDKLIKERNSTNETHVIQQEILSLKNEFQTLIENLDVNQEKLEENVANEIKHFNNKLKNCKNSTDKENYLNLIAKFNRLLSLPKQIEDLEKKFNFLNKDKILAIKKAEFITIAKRLDISIENFLKSVNIEIEYLNNKLKQRETEDERKKLNEFNNLIQLYKEIHEDSDDEDEESKKIKQIIKEISSKKNEFDKLLTVSKVDAENFDESARTDLKYYEGKLNKTQKESNKVTFQENIDVIKKLMKLKPEILILEDELEQLKKIELQKNEMKFLRNDFAKLIEKYKLDMEDENLEEKIKELIERRLEKQKKTKNQNEIEIIGAEIVDLNRLKEMEKKIKSLDNPNVEIVPVHEEHKEEPVIKKDDQNPKGKDEKPEFLTNEELVEQENDLYELPDSVEKLILNLILIIRRQLLQTNSSISKEVLCSHYDKIRQKIMKNMMVTLFIKERLSELKTHLQSEDLIQSLKSLNLLLEQYRVINIRELSRLVYKAKEAEFSVTGKEIVVLLSGTGAGKSTTIRYFCGCEMVQDPINKHIEAVDNNGIPELNKVISSCKTISETRYLTYIPIPPRILKKLVGDDDYSLNFCDSPGFGETAGAEVDIANNIGIVNGFSKCKSVKIVILVSWNSLQDKAIEFRKLLISLMGMIPDISDRLDSFLFLFTKCDESDETIIERINQFKKDLSEVDKSNKNLKELLQKMKNDIIKVNPLDGDPKKIIRAIFRLTAIKNPANSFKASISIESRQKVNQEVSLCSDLINNALLHSDYPYATEKLDELKTLSEILSDNDNVKSKYKECCGTLSQEILKKWQSSMTKFNKCLLPENSLHQEDIILFKEALIQAKDKEFIKMRDKHLASNELAFDRDIFENNLIGQFSEYLKDIVNNELDDSNNTKIIFKLCLLSEYFSETCHNFWSQIFKIIQEKLIQISRNVERDLSENNYEAFANEMTKLKSFNGNFSQVLNGIDRTLEKQETSEEEKGKLKQLKEKLIAFSREISTYYDRNIEKCLDSLNQIYKDVEILFLSFSKQHMESLKQQIVMLDQVKNLLPLHNHIESKKIQAINDRILEIILKYFENTNKEIVELQKNSDLPEDLRKKEKIIKNMKEKLEILEGVKNISKAVELSIISSYNNSLVYLKNFIESTNKDYDKMKTALADPEKGINISSKMVNSLLYITRLNWLENFYPGYHQDIIGDIKDNIENFVHNLKYRLKAIKVDIFKSENLMNFGSIYKNLQKSSELKKLAPDIEKELQDADNTFKNKLKSPFECIKKLIDKFEVEEGTNSDQNLQKNKEILQINMKIIQIYYIFILDCEANEFEEFAVIEGDFTNLKTKFHGSLNYIYTCLIDVISSICLIVFKNENTELNEELILKNRKKLLTI